MINHKVEQKKEERRVFKLFKEVCTFYDIERYESSKDDSNGGPDIIAHLRNGNNINFQLTEGACDTSKKDKTQKQLDSIFKNLRNEAMKDKSEISRILKEKYKTSVYIDILEPYNKFDNKDIIRQVENALKIMSGDSFHNSDIQITVSRCGLGEPDIHFNSALLLPKTSCTILSLKNKLKQKSDGNLELLLHYSDPTYVPRDYEMNGIKEFIIGNMVSKFSRVWLFKAYNDYTNPILWRYP